MAKENTTRHAPQQTASVERFFHGYAAEFDSIYGGRSNPIQRFIDRTFRRSMILRFLKVMDELQDPAMRSVLDIGCGSGRYALEYLKLGHKVVGIDLAQGMLDLAKKACERSFPQGDFTFVHADYLELPLGEKCDAAVLIGFFDYMPDPLEVFLKLKEETRSLILASFPKAGGLLSVQRKIRYRLRGVPLFFYREEDIRAILQGAALTDYEIIDLGRDLFLKVRFSQ